MSFSSIGRKCLYVSFFLSSSEEKALLLQRVVIEQRHPHGTLLLALHEFQNEDLSPVKSNSNPNSQFMTNSYFQ